MAHLLRGGPRQSPRRPKLGQSRLSVHHQRHNHCKQWAEAESVRFSWTEQFSDRAFQHPPIQQVWPETVPMTTDILLRHGPPKGRLDMEGKGCPRLLKEIWRVKPRPVVFRHIRDGHRMEQLVFDTVQRPYDGAMMGRKGLTAVLMLACRVLSSSIWNALSWKNGARRCARHHIGQCCSSQRPGKRRATKDNHRESMSCEAGFSRYLANLPHSVMNFQGPCRDKQVRCLMPFPARACRAFPNL
jgi:hypothetical protein